MTARQTRYPHPLIERYASAEIAEVFSPLRRALLWRDLWIALARAQKDLGAEIPADAISAMQEAREQIDLTRVAELEAELRHDVMAHIRHFGEVAPAAAPYIHLAATSCFVTDNADLVQMREALGIIGARLRTAIEALAGFASRWKDLPTLGYTHWQPAQPTTVGKRAAVWLQDLVSDLEEVERASAGLRFRGARGTTGTEASFLDLFGGDGAKVDALNERLCREFGFPATYDVVGQTYPRKVDARVVGTLAGIGASCARFGQDVRLLQSFGEVEEPFGRGQVGSSAMPYKRNPMRSERICGLARHLIALQVDAAATAAAQGLERTLDDSANRRLVIPEAFLLADAVLSLVANVAAGLVVHVSMVESRLRRALPFLAVERILLVGVRRGGDRQELHEILRRHAMAARKRLDEGAEENDFLERVASDERVGLSREELAALADAGSLAGRAGEQVERFLRERVDPILAAVDAPAPAEPRV